MCVCVCGGGVGGGGSVCEEWGGTVQNLIRLGNNMVLKT